jgi:hypothetical protein
MKSGVLPKMRSGPVDPSRALERMSRELDVFTNPFVKSSSAIVKRASHASCSFDGAKSRTAPRDAPAPAPESLGRRSVGSSRPPVFAHAERACLLGGPLRLSTSAIASTLRPDAG